ncbi:MAG: alanine--tRNA ligase [Dehalococcoidia bacterium]|nr:MAG: alanine--tRNA ligase [Dehalococcoidia bacterium]
MKHTQIRNEYLRFFESKGHRVVPSDSLVPAGDPTLLFTSAGMAQFKNEFMGNIKDFTCAVSCQKCMRTADLENVGKTAYHHSFFEMLGNFSFGDYFKKEAIAWAWEFLTQTLKLETQSLCVSVYEEDDEAYDIWKDAIKVPSARIVKFGQKDNFWPSEAKDKGPNGPCGPCSEIYYDYGKETGCGKPDCSPSCSCGRFVEVWNLVFTQFNRKDGGVLEPLPNKNIDTGMGVERLCAVMQGVRNNFQTDLFVPIIETIRKELNVLVAKNSSTGLHTVAEQPRAESSGRVPCLAGSQASIHAVADHVRAVTFAISDGITPSNEERGYVIRNILRKALLHAMDLGADGPILHKIVYSVAKTMQEPYPELLEKHQEIACIIKFEEERFINTLNQGRRLLDSVIKNTKKFGKHIISGEDAFRLFDTHGLPLAIIRELCSKQGLDVNEKVFNLLMEDQREQSRRSSNLSGAVFVDTGIKESTTFIGYDRDSSEARVLRIMLPDGADVTTIDASVPIAEIILDESVFYPQQGGQEFDRGRIYSELMEAEVLSAKKIQDAILLEARVLKGKISKGDIIGASIDTARRIAIARNHTATHLLQSALREVLGGHVQQQGSMVDADRLRFDFTHFKAMTEDELKKSEGLVGEYIRQALPVSVEEMAIAQAKKTGALAFFGEKYGQKVRVIKTGDKSIELCGGTHVKNTSEIKLFRIMRESSVASGVRRIEASTADYASAWELEHEKNKKEKIQALKNKQNEKARDKTFVKQAEELVDDIISGAENVNSTTLIIKCLDGQNMSALKRISDIIKTKLKQEYIIFLVALEGRKASLLMSAGKKKGAISLDSSQLLEEILKPFSGSGGGRPDMAQGGIRELRDKDAFLKTARDILHKSLKESK